MIFFGKEKKESLVRGLDKTRESLFQRIARAITGKSQIDDDVLASLEEVLIASDVGVETTIRIIRRLEERVAREKTSGIDSLNRILREETEALLAENPAGGVTDFAAPLPVVPYVIMVVGVNGVGKTTTIGKLAWHYRQAGKKVLLGAADTFRAAAIDQLAIWAERSGAELIRQQMGSDPASVAYDALNAAKARGADVVIVDTAGRLHNKVNLMNELSKVRKVMQR
ncbi:MAG TPA: signaling recognition particle receptor family protein, partial [Bacteroidales bacterium]|nr:signaling recognition particle receptor family protein [Bacteroidales bacterium]